MRAFAAAQRPKPSTRSSASEATATSVATGEALKIESLAKLIILFYTPLLMKQAARKRERPSFAGSVAEAPSSREVRSLVEAGRFRDAILRASKFADLGDHRDRILSAREAYQRPEFQKQIGKDPDALIADGIAALRERYVAGC